MRIIHNLSTSSTNFNIYSSHDTGQHCHCVSEHVPQPQELERHHIRPKANGGSDDPSNLVWLCPTTHMNVHELMRFYFKWNGNVPWEMRRKFNKLARYLAERGYRESISEPRTTL